MIYRFTSLCFVVPLMHEVCIIEFGLAGGGSFDFQCRALYSDIKKFSEEKHLQLHMTGLTRALLGFPKSSEYPVGSLGR